MLLVRNAAPRALRLARATALLMLVSAPAFAQEPPKLFADSKYGFAFQYPSDWKVQKLPPRDEGGEVRAYIKHPSRPVFVVASVGELGYRLTRQEYLAHKEREKLNASLLDWVRIRLYRKTSLELGASKMEIAREEVTHDETGILLYLATGNTVESGTVAVAGQHVLPFGKTHLVSFILVSPADLPEGEDSEILNHVFNSFHMTVQGQ